MPRIPLRTHLGRMGRRPWARGRISLGVLLLAGLACTLVQCGGGGGSRGGVLDVVTFSSTLQSPRVYLNGEIEIEFTQPIDPQTVFSGIFIYPSQGAGSKRARGEWRVEGKRAIFSPTLPTDAAFLNGGLLPNTEYTICIPRPGDSCSLHIQNMPGVRSTAGRGMAIRRTERFLTVDLQSQGPFEPEVPPVRPTVARVDVADSEGVEQKLNPITNLYSSVKWAASVLTTITGSPASTLAPPPQATAVPRYEWTKSELVKRVVSPFSPQDDVVKGEPLAIVMRAPDQPVTPGEFEDTGGVLVIRDSSSPPVEGRWAVDTNTDTVITTKVGSGPDFAKVPFRTAPLYAIVDQGITRQVAPGDVLGGTEVRVTFTEPLRSPQLASFAMYRVTDTQQGLQFDTIPLADTATGAPRQGLTHEILNGRSVVTLRPKTSFPQSRPDEPATTVLWMATALPDNAIDPLKKSSGLRDLNDFPLAYPVRSGWVRGDVAEGQTSYTGYIERLDYTNPNVPVPGNVQTMWGFQTRHDTAVLNAIVEDFTNTANRSGECATTAAWAAAGTAGLQATYGFGGNGELGDEFVSGSKILDSSTGSPGPDGFVTYNFNRLTVTASGNLVLTGPHPIRINSIETITIDGTVDASGAPGRAAPAGTSQFVGVLAGGAGGPGGGAGGPGNARPQDPLGSVPGDLRGGPGWPAVKKACGEFNRSANRLVNPIESNCGGGFGGNRGLVQSSVPRSGCGGNGGGHEADGQRTDLLCLNPQSYGMIFGVKWAFPIGAQPVEQPTAGAGGGGGGNAQTNPAADARSDICGGSGGGGGGAVELVSADQVLLTPGARVFALGGNGGTGFSTLVNSTSIAGGYGGGGAGGSLWLSGTSVTVQSGVVIDARGGQGNPNPPSSGLGGDGGPGYVILRDLGGTPVYSGATVNPAPVSQRGKFTPAENGLSTAYSVFYDSGQSDPAWAFAGNDPKTGQAVAGDDLEWGTSPVQGQSCTISFQGAPDRGGKSNPNPATWIPAGNTAQDPCAYWETDIAKIKAAGGMRHLRFRVQFDVGPRSKGQPTAPSRISIRRLRINYPNE